MTWAHRQHPESSGDIAPDVRDAAKRVIPFAAAVAVLGAIGLLLYGAVCAFDMSTRETGKQNRGKVLNRTLAEDLVVTRHGVYGVEFVKCRSCRLVKRKKGLLTFGGLNVLVMDGLSVVIPPDEEWSEASEVGDSPRNLARRLGVSDGFLSSRGLPVKFSGLRISDLSVSRLVSGNKTELVFSAQRAEAVRGGLSLRGCVIVLPDGVHESVGSAMLIKEGGDLRLKWHDKTIEIT